MSMITFLGQRKMQGSALTFCADQEGEGGYELKGRAGYKREGGV
jgi:hypothetical protein